MVSPLDKFFKLGDKITKGDPIKTMDFNYYLLWIMFLAFCSVMIGNLYEFYLYHKLHNLGWSIVIMAILWFQYQGLKQTYDTRKMLKSNLQPPELESEQEMLQEFDKIDDTKLTIGGKNEEICDKT